MSMMMHTYNYDQILGLNKDFSPYYDLLNESDVAWQSFVLTNQFYELLNNTLDSLEKSNVSLWLQGAYGTGKSHATGYLKQLLWIAVEKLEPELLRFNDEQIKNRLHQFRKNKRVFPVVMYGADKITNQIDFGLQIEIGVRNALKKHGIDLTTQTDFETYANHIEQDNSNYWDLLISEEYELEEIVSDKQQMIKRLRSFDQDLFIVLRNILNKRMRPIAVPDIVQWLSEVSTGLRERGVADYMMIYWDEFTTIMDKQSSDIHEHIQRIAEASQKSGVFLYIISHRTVVQGSSSKDDRNKLLGRFIDSHYEMPAITTYLLISNSIQKLDPDQWKTIRDSYQQFLTPIAREIMKLEAGVEESNLLDLFPIHPYSAHIATFIARVMGSTKRSIFNFLFDDKHGFLHFIANNPKNNNQHLMTVDYVFDFFYSVFENQDDPFINSVLQRYKFNLNEIKKENPHYVSLFKALLIMNIAHRKINLKTEQNDLVIPDNNNLEMAMLGSNKVQYINDFLQYLDNTRILLRDHKDRYVVETSNIDSSEIQDWIFKNSDKYAKIQDILVKEQQELLCAPLLSNHRRKDEVDYTLADSKEYVYHIRNRIGQKLKNDYRLNFLVIVAHGIMDLEEIQKQIPELLSEVDHSVCAVVLDKLFDDETYDRYMHYKAQAEIALSKRDEESENTNKKNIDGHLKQWIREANDHGYLTWFLKDKDKNIISDKCAYRGFSEIIDNKIAPTIFYKSIDTIFRPTSAATAWDTKMAKKAAEVMLTSLTLTELLEKSRQGPMKAAAEILMDKNGAYLVDNRLDYIDKPQDHPLIILEKMISNALKSNEEINIGDAFEPLFKAPFGYYKNHVFISAISFSLRKYLGKLYSPDIGEKIDQIALLEIIEKLFKYQCDGNNLVKSGLRVRLGSKSESKLVSLVQEIFELSEVSSIVELRHKLGEKLKQELKLPLWILRFHDEIDDEVKMCVDIIADNVFDIASHKTNFSSKEYDSFVSDLHPHKDSLKDLFASIDEDRRKQLMLSFVKEQDIDKLPGSIEDHLDSFRQHLINNLQGDPVYWSEEYVKDELKKWMLSFLHEALAEKESMQGEPGSEQTFSEKREERVRLSFDKEKLLEQLDSHQDAAITVLKRLILEDDWVSQKIYELLNEELQ